MHQLKNDNKGVSVFLTLFFVLAVIMVCFYGKLSVLTVTAVTVLTAALFAVLPTAAAAAVAAAAIFAGSFLARDEAFCLLLVVFCMPPAVIAAVLTKMRFDFKKSVVAASAATGVAVISLLTRIAYNQGSYGISGFLDFIKQNVRAQVMNLILFLEQNQGQLFETYKLSSKDLADLFENALLRNLTGIFAVACILLGFAAVLAAKTALRLKGDKTDSIFKDFKISPAGAGLFAAALVLRFIPGSVSVVADNFIFVMIPGLMLEGTVFISFLLEKRLLGGTTFYIFIATLLLMSPITTFLILASFGAADSLFGEHLRSKINNK